MAIRLESKITSVRRIKVYFVVFAILYKKNAEAPGPLFTLNAKFPVPFKT